MNTATADTRQRERAARAPKLRLTRRGRAVVTTLAALPLVAGLAVAALNGGGATATSERAGRALQVVTVDPGATLWEIALEVAPDADPRDVVAELKSLNRLDGSEVQPGQRLAVPPRYA